MALRLLLLTARNSLVCASSSGWGEFVIAGGWIRNDEVLLRGWVVGGWDVSICSSCWSFPLGACIDSCIPCSWVGKSSSSITMSSSRERAVVGDGVDMGSFCGIIEMRGDGDSVLVRLPVGDLSSSVLVSAKDGEKNW